MPALTELVTSYQQNRDERVFGEILYQTGELMSPHLAAVRRSHPNNYDDVKAELNLSLLLCMERFEPARELEFSTFAVPRLVGTIRDCHRREHPGGRRGLDAEIALRRCEERAYKLGRKPTPNEYRASLEQTTASKQMAEHWLATGHLNPHTVRLDKFANTAAPTICDKMVYDELVADLEADVNDLVQRNPRYGAIATKFIFEGMSGTQIARSQGVTPSCVSRIWADIRAHHLPRARRHLDDMRSNAA